MHACSLLTKHKRKVISAYSHRQKTYNLLLKRYIIVQLGEKEEEGYEKHTFYCKV